MKIVELLILILLVMCIGYAINANAENIDTEHFLMQTEIVDGVDLEEFDCMVSNLYHEARGEGFSGMYAVAMVVMNRVEDTRYPNSICEVVKQGPVDAKGNPKKHRCQFSWWCDGNADTIVDTKSVKLAELITEVVYISSAVGNGYMLVDVTEGSTHYHTTAVSPNWRNDRGMTEIGRFGSHIFYRWD